MSMLESIVSALIVALIGLPAFLAYKHYSVYTRISSRLSTYAFALALAVIAFNFGKYLALAEIPELVEVKDLMEKQDILMRNIQVSALIYFAFLIYLTVLDCLPKILGKERSDE